jgi:hypothetical protein
LAGTGAKADSQLRSSFPSKADVEKTALELAQDSFAVQHLVDRTQKFPELTVGTF